MYNYIYSEEEVLTGILNNFQFNFKEAFKRLFIVGCGSSFNAGKIVEPFAANYGLAITVMHPVEFISTQDKFYRDDLVIFISQVGNSALVVKALRRAKGSCITLGLTANDQGIIAKEADYHINIGCGEENTNAKSKGVSATVLNLLLFIMNYSLRNGYIDKETFDKELQELKEIIGRLNSYTRELESEIKPLIDNIQQDDHLWILASGNNYSVTREFAMKVVECSYLKTSYKELEEFLHGFEMGVDQKDILIILAFDDYSRELGKGIKKFMMEEKIAKQVYIVSSKDCDITSSAPDSKYNIFVNLALLQLVSYSLAVKFHINYKLPRYTNINDYVVTKL